MQAKATIEDGGGIRIPDSLLRAVGLKPSDVVLIEVAEQGLLIRPVQSVALETYTYTEERIAELASDDEAIGKLLPKRSS